jgi:beta-glucosidase-like glycosyl hydrolase
LHWLDDQDAVAGGVRGTLAPGGRFVAELGDRGNVRRIRRAVAEELAARGYEVPDSVYFPSVGEHASLFERHGFEVRYATLFDRPTELEDGADGLRDWLGLFGRGLLAPVDDAEREALLAAVEERLRRTCTTWRRRRGRRTTGVRFVVVGPQ